jgi:hypothetical protein
MSTFQQTRGQHNDIEKQTVDVIVSSISHKNNNALNRHSYDYMRTV